MGPECVLSLSPHRLPTGPPARPTDPSSPCPGHCGPEEAPPVRVLEDVGQHAGEKPAAVQDNLLLLLRMAATLGSLHQLLHSLRGQAAGHAGWVGSGDLTLGVRTGTPGLRGDRQTGSASPGGREVGQRAA